MTGSVHDVTDTSFEAEVRSSGLPVVVDVWAPWCGPCRMVSPVVAELAEENAGKIKVCKLNVDENPEEAGKLGITSIPTILFYKGGKERTEMRLVGVRSKAEYQAAIDQLTVA